jgi:hypothetical protein
MTYFGKTGPPDYVRKMALDKAGKTCQFPLCTTRNGLEIHYIDGNNQNNNINNNLIVLCPMHKSRIRGYRTQELVSWASGEISPNRRSGRT